LGNATDVPDNDKVTYNSFGTRNKENLENTVAMILHARRKTNGDVTIVNTHPFVELGNDTHPNVALIHNGTIVNHYQLTKKYSTCDSEVILHEYLKKDMHYNPKNIKEVADTLVGQYTVGVLSSLFYEGQKAQPILDIFKSNKGLFAGFVKELDTIVFSTSKYTLEEAIDETGMTLVGCVEIKDGYFMRLNAITGEAMNEPLPFPKSKEAIYPTYTPSAYTPSAYTPKHNGYPTPPTPATPKKETINDVKHQFEAAHSELFTTTYYDPDRTLNPIETLYLSELEAAPETNFRALRLVKKVMGL
jgi:hypothetical protein